MTGEKRFAAVHGRAPDGILKQVRVHVDMTVLEEHPEAGMTLSMYASAKPRFDLRDTRAALDFYPQSFGAL